MSDSPEATPVGDPGATTNDPATDPTKEKNMTMQAAEEPKQDPPVDDEEPESDDADGEEDGEGGNDEEVAAAQLASAVEGPLLSPVPGEQQAVLPPKELETPKVEETPPAAPRLAVGARMPSDDDVPAPKKVAEAPPPPKPVAEAKPAPKQAPAKPVYAGAAAAPAKPAAAVAAPAKAADSDPPPSIKVGKASVAVGAATMAAIDADMAGDQPQQKKPASSPWTSKATTSTGGGTHKTPPEVIAAQMNAGKGEVQDDATHEPDPPAGPQPTRFDTDFHGDNAEDVEEKRRAAERPRSYDLTPAVAATEDAGVKKKWLPLSTGIALLALAGMLGVICFLLFRKDTREAGPAVTGRSPAGSTTTPAATTKLGSCEPVTPANLTEYFEENDPSDFKSTAPLDKSKPYLKCGKGQAKKSAHGFNVSACLVCVPRD